MGRLGYFFRSAARGIVRSPLRSVLCAATSGVALAVLCAYLLLYMNLEGMLTSWGADLDLSVYLKDDATPEARDRLGAWLRARPEVGEVRFVDRAQVTERLRREYPKHVDVWQGAADLPIEASFEVRLSPAHDLRAALARLAADVRALPDAAGAEYGARELSRVEGALDLLRGAGGVLAAVLALAAMFVVGTTVRLAIRDRRDELEIMRLCGATNAFIRAPLYLEGALQGLLGGVLALGLVALLHTFLEGSLADVLAPSASAAAQLSFLSGELAAGVVGGAMLLGASGSALAASRYLRA